MTSSASSRNASASNAPCSRFRAKPSISFFTVAGTWPALTMRSRVRSTTAGSVQGAGQSSTNGTRYGGLTGWAIRQRFRVGRCSVKALAGMPEDDDASTASGFAARSSSAKTPILTSTRSGPFSWMYSASRTASHSDCIGRMRPSTTSGSSASRPAAAQLRQTVGNECQCDGCLLRKLVPEGDVETGPCEHDGPGSADQPGPDDGDVGHAGFSLFVAGNAMRQALRATGRVAACMIDAAGGSFAGLGCRRKRDEQHDPGGGAGRLAGRGARRGRLVGAAGAGRGGVFCRCLRRCRRRRGETGGFRHRAVDAGADAAARLADQPAAEAADAGDDRGAESVAGYGGLHGARDRGVQHAGRRLRRFGDGGTGAGSADLGGARPGGRATRRSGQAGSRWACRSGSVWPARPWA